MIKRFIALLKAVRMAKKIVPALVDCLNVGNDPYKDETILEIFKEFKIPEERVETFIDGAIRIILRNHDELSN